jgi:hypothetical protein
MNGGSKSKKKSGVSQFDLLESSVPFCELSMKHDYKPTYARTPVRGRQRDRNTEQQERMEHGSLSTIAGDSSLRVEAYLFLESSHLAFGFYRSHSVLTLFIL